MDFSRWTSVFQDSLEPLVAKVVGYLPNVLGALMLLLLGWLLARLLRVISARLIGGGLNRLGRNLAIRRSLERTGLRETIPNITSRLLYWVIWLLFIAAAIEQLDLAVISSLLAGLVAYLPKVFLALLVAFVGLVAGNLSRHWVATAVAKAGATYGEILGRISQIAIWLMAVVVGADQIGIQSTFLMLMVAILLGTTLGGAALAFGLGSGPAVGNIIASYYVSKNYRTGQTVRIGGVEGTIIEMTPTAVMIGTADGRVLMPARKFSEESSVLLTRG